MLGLDVGDVGVGVKCITNSDDVCLISDDVLDDGFRRDLYICRDDGSNQTVRFLWTWRCPAQRTKIGMIFSWGDCVGLCYLGVETLSVGCVIDFQRAPERGEFFQWLHGVPFAARPIKLV